MYAMANSNKRSMTVGVFKTHEARRMPFYRRARICVGSGAD